MKIILAAKTNNDYTSEDYSQDYEIFRNQFFRFFTASYTKIFDRPYYFLSEGKTLLGNPTYYYLKKEMHEWLESYDIQYEIYPTILVDESFTEWNIEILDERIAILFKLTWG